MPHKRRQTIKLRLTVWVGGLLLSNAMVTSGRKEGAHASTPAFVCWVWAVPLSLGDGADMPMLEFVASQGLHVGNQSWPAARGGDRPWQK
jgi:hypothetical protein